MNIYNRDQEAGFSALQFQSAVAEPCDTMPSESRNNELYIGEQSGRRRVSRGVLLFLVLLVGGSFIPLRWKVWLGSHGPWHLKAHFAMFAIFAWLGCLSVRSLASRVKVCAAIVLVAFGIEAGQSAVFGNGLERADIRADLAGTAFALVFTEMLSRRKAPTRQPDDFIP